MKDILIRKISISYSTKLFRFFSFRHCFESETFVRISLYLCISHHVSRLGARSWPDCALWLFWVLLESRDLEHLECWANPLWERTPHLQSFHRHFEVRPSDQSFNSAYFLTVALSVFKHSIFHWSQINIKEILSVVGQALLYGLCSSVIPQHQRCFVHV